MFRRSMLGVFVAAALFMSADSHSFGQTRDQLVKQAREVQNLINSYTANRDRWLARGDAIGRRYAQILDRAISQLQGRLQQLRQAIAQAGGGVSGGSGGGGRNNSCDLLRQQIQRNARNSRARAYQQLARRTPRRGVVVVYRLLMTTHCHQRLIYSSRRQTFVSGYQARRTIDRITNNGGVVDQIYIY